MDKGKLLFIRENGQRVYELDYALFMIKYNPEYKTKKYKIALLSGNKKLGQTINKNIWKKAYLKAGKSKTRKK